MSLISYRYERCGRQSGIKGALQGIKPDSSNGVALTTAKQASILGSCSEVKRGSGAKRA
jgi:hypothetical protein